MEIQEIPKAPQGSWVKFVGTWSGRGLAHKVTRVPFRTAAILGEDCRRLVKARRRVQGQKDTLAHHSDLAQSSPAHGQPTGLLTRLKGYPRAPEGFWVKFVGKWSGRGLAHKVKRVPFRTPAILGEACRRRVGPRARKQGPRKINGYPCQGPRP